MGLRAFASNSVKVIIGGSAFISTFYTMIELMYFLSSPVISSKPPSYTDYWLSASWGLFINMSLLSLFVLQHSLLAMNNVKGFITKYGLQDVYRSIYVLFTIGALQVMMKYWHSTSEVIFWKFNTSYKPFWWLYAAVHVIAWLVIYIGNICMDLNELLGIKQIYYSIRELPDPNVRKSNQLRRLHSHMRHPSFLAFLLIFWSIPVMSLDRLLLATIFTVYMYIAWNTDDMDYAYQKTQYIRKFHELERLHD